MHSKFESTARGRHGKLTFPTTERTYPVVLFFFLLLCCWNIPPVYSWIVIPQQQRFSRIQQFPDRFYPSKTKLKQRSFGKSMIRLQSDLESTRSVSSSSLCSTAMDAIYEIVESRFPGAQVMTFVLEHHQPMGCTIEESLVCEIVDDDNFNSDDKKTIIIKAYEEQDEECHNVFVSKLVPGGNAQLSGLKVGDVIVGVTSIFAPALENDATHKNENEEKDDDIAITPVSGLEISKVKNMIGSIPEDFPLTICIARGTNVLELHELGMKELCENPIGASDKEIEDCVIDFLASGYSLDDDNESENDNMMNEQVNMDQVLNSLRLEDEQISTNGVADATLEDDAECMLDDIHCLWGEEIMSIPSVSTENWDDNNNESSQSVDNADVTKKVKPWSSRSSPSGTYVRDPRTGKMRNIDA